MARRPVDYTAQMQAVEDRRRQQEEKQRKEQQREQQLRERQALSYGQVAIAILGDRITIDEFAGRLLDSRDQGTANPQLKTEWTARGAAHFPPGGSNRHRKSGAPGAAGSNGAAGNGEHHNGHQPPAPRPSRPRPTSPPATDDLLGGIAADRSGSGTAAKGGDDGEQP